MEEVEVPAGREVLVDVDDNSALIVGNPRGILGQQLKPQPIYSLNFIIMYILYVPFDF